MSDSGDMQNNELIKNDLMKNLKNIKEVEQHTSEK